MTRHLRVGLLTVGAAVLLGGAAYWLCQSYLPARALREGSELLRSGLTGMAEERIDCYRRKLVRSAEGCMTLLQTYQLNQNRPRLQWAAETCLTHGVRTPEAYLALASALEATNRDSDALTLLLQAATDHAQNPALPLAMGRIYERNGRAKEAERAFNNAVKRGPGNARVLADAAFYFIRAKNLGRARELAAQLAEDAEQNENVRAAAAEIFEKAGDASRAKALLSGGGKR